MRVVENNPNQFNLLVAIDKFSLVGLSGGLEIFLGRSMNIDKVIAEIASESLE